MKNSLIFQIIIALVVNINCNLEISNYLIYSKNNLNYYNFEKPIISVYNNSRSFSPTLLLLHIFNKIISIIIFGVYFRSNVKLYKFKNNFCMPIN